MAKRAFRKTQFDNLHQAAALIQHGMVWIDEAGNIQGLNAEFAGATGYHEAQFEPKTVFQLLPQINLLEWRNCWKSMQEKQGHYLEATLAPAGVGGLALRILLVPVQSGETPLAWGILAEEPAGMEARTEDRRLMQYSIDNTSQMIYWLQPDGRFIYANKAFCEKLGYSISELQNMQLADLEPELSVAAWENRWRKLKQEGTLELEVIRKTKSGEWIPVMLHLNYLKYKGREYNLAFASDLRKKKKMEQVLQNRLDEIEALHRQLEEENILLKEEIQIEQGPTNIISQSPNYKNVLRQIHQVADTNATVLILGETGTGKELIAKAIHRLSGRSERPMIKVDCGALPENLIESELFGYEKGAFTGAYQRKPGRFERAHRGTIFLDEIGELPLDLQVKLLRVLQEGTFEPLGSTEPKTVDVRVIAATNRNLEEQVRRGKFREDLYYRLNVFPIFNIPLRERKEDIVPLVRHFIEKYNKKLGKHIEEIAPSVLKILEEYEFPGNVRELENLIERAVILSPGKSLAAGFQFKKSRSGGKTVFKTMDAMQREHILDALRRSNGQITGKGGAASLLGMHDKTLYSRMQKLGISRYDYTK
ncbi:MAG: sigma 54-interacting transcriptional regulator [Lewinellaceae bacterium]|nr:sigma 54-interacting transcriptional regulator [Lewinellaceae bacterium]